LHGAFCLNGYRWKSRRGCLELLRERGDRGACLLPVPVYIQGHTTCSVAAVNSFFLFPNGHATEFADDEVFPDEGTTLRKFSCAMGLRPRFMFFVPCIVPTSTQSVLAKLSQAQDHKRTVLYLPTSNMFARYLNMFTSRDLVFSALWWKSAWFLLMPDCLFQLPFRHCWPIMEET